MKLKRLITGLAWKAIYIGIFIIGLKYFFRWAGLKGFFLMLIGMALMAFLLISPHTAGKMDYFITLLKGDKSLLSKIRGDDNGEDYVEIKI